MPPERRGPPTRVCAHPAQRKGGLLEQDHDIARVAALGARSWDEAVVPRVVHRRVQDTVERDR